MDAVLVGSRARLDIQGTAQGYTEADWLCGSYVLQREGEYTLPLVPVGALWLTNFHVSRLLQASMLGSSSSNLHVQNSQFTRCHHFQDFLSYKHEAVVVFPSIYLAIKNEIVID